MTASRIEAIARRQLADYDLHHPGRIFEDSSLSMTVAEAYQVQRHVAALRVARGEPVAGYKIGCLSEAVQRQLGIDRPACGHLYATEIYRSGAVLDPAAFDGLAIEGEFALRIAEDIPGPGWLREHPDRAAVAVFAVIELHNHVFRGSTPTAQELIANNALHAGVVLPLIEGPLRDPDELAREPISVYRNGQILGTAAGGAIPGGAFASLLKVSEHLASFGAQLKRDQIVLTGSPLPLYPAGPGDDLVVRSSRLADVRMTVSRNLPGILEE